LPATIEDFIERFSLDDPPVLSATRTGHGVTLDNGKIQIDWEVTPDQFEELIRRYDRDAVDALGVRDGLSLLVSRFYERMEAGIPKSGRMVVRRRSLSFEPYDS
jgi:hypothetical protein